MDIKQVRQALALYKHGTFTRAAKAINLTQPTITESIQKLEDELGARLFLRDGAGCRPTGFGLVMLPRFEQIVNEFDTALETAQDFVKFRRVPLRIAVLSTIGLERLAPCLARQQIAQPQIEIEVITTSFEDLSEGLASGLYDLGIGSMGEISGDLFQVDLLYKEGYVLAFPKSHPFAEQAEIGLKQIEAEVLLDRPKCEMRDRLLRQCAEDGINLYAPHRTNSVALLKLQIQAGVGVAVLPRYSLEPDHPHIEARPLALDAFDRDVVAIRREEQVTRPEVNALLVQMKRSLKKDCAA